MDIHQPLKAYLLSIAMILTVFSVHEGEIHNWVTGDDNNMALLYCELR